MKCLYTSDLHGNRDLYERLFALARDENVEAILFGGDLSPLEPPLDVMIEKQREFWVDFLAPRAQELNEAGIRTILIPGNDDLAIHNGLLVEGDDTGLWELVDGTWTELGEYWVVGCGWISPSPFLLKDREYYDVEIGALPDSGLIDLHDPNVIRSIPRDEEDLQQTLWRELDHLLSLVPKGSPTILMAHCPPRQTALDVVYDGRHVGSEAVRRVIESFEPVLALHGHIHESPDMETGHWRDVLGPTISVNPGSCWSLGDQAKLQVVSFDTESIADSIDYRRL